MNEIEFYREKLKKDKQESLDFFRGLFIALPIGIGLWVLIILFLLWLFGCIAQYAWIGRIMKLGKIN